MDVGDSAKAVASLRHGDHVCALFETRDEQVRMTTEYVRQGLAAGERCVHIAAEAPDPLRQAMWEGGINVDDAERRSALVVMTAPQVYLKDGRFDAARMLSMLDHALEDAREARFEGLRVSGDMTWLIDDPRGADQILEYEALVNQVFSDSAGIALCFYHRRRMPRKVLDSALRTHPLVILGGRLRANQFYQPPPVSRAPQGPDADVEWKLRELER